MKKYVCRMCGYVELKDTPPDKCPNCGAPKSQFEEQVEALKIPEDPDNLNELEKKHIAQITASGVCGLIPGCTDVNIKIGSTLHPMNPEKHWIMFADIYLDKEFISRIKFNPRYLNPAAGIHLKTAEGVLEVVSHCNLHGNYISEKKL